MKNFDIAIIGASIGGVMAAYSAAKSGLNVLLTEETDWIGGQFTSQAVPPDEHKWIETTGCTQTYRDFRNKIRDHYRKHPYIIDELKNKDYFCPGGSSVSRIAHPPKLALSILNEMLKPLVDCKKLTIFLSCKLESVKSTDTEILEIALDNGEIIQAKYYLDGTDFGDLIAKSGTQYESGSETDRLDMQPCTWVGAVDFDNHPNADHVGVKPAEYDFFKRLKMPYDKYDVLSMYGPDSTTGKAKQFGFFNGETGEKGQPLFGLFTYRRIVASHHFKDNFEPKDITLINWPQNDYFLDNLIESTDDEHNAYMARQLTLSLIYWLQTEYERPDGKKGYRQLSLRGNVLGTSDGLAKFPYVRECRRIKSKFTVTESMISKRSNSVLPKFSDSIGVGSYHIDLHITTRSHSFFFDEAYPFQIPLGAMIPVRMKNLIPACKNIGTTHLTNGCYRLHPIEWNIGEVAGYLAAYSIKNNVSVCEIYENKEILKKFQDYICDKGIQIEWKNI